MGQLRFRVPKSQDYDPQIWSTAFVSGIEGIPWAGKNRLDGDCFIVERAVSDSGKLSIVWPTDEFGPILLSTASLRCQDDPYFLQLELARGTLHRIRGRAMDWQRLGLKLPESFTSLMDRSVSAFVQALLSSNDPDRCSGYSQASIDLAISASKPLTRAFISQSLQARHTVEKQLSTLLGIKLSPNQPWEADIALATPAINTIQISMELGQIETESKNSTFAVIDAQLNWARQNSLRVFAGPLINLQPHAIPNWFYLFNDFESLYDAACKHAIQMVERYRGQVHLWSAAAGLNAPNPLGISDEQILHLAVGVIQAVRRCDPKTPVVLSIDCPWAEYLGQKIDGISPLHFADALIRADLGLSGLGLEVNFNYWPGGSLPRDLVDLSDLIDHWNILGLPLLVQVTSPNHMQPDAKSSSKASIVSSWAYPPIYSCQPQVADGNGAEPSDSPTVSHPLTESEKLGLLPRRERLPVNGLEIMQMLLAKTNVHGIVWSQFSDRSDHAFPNAGLIAGNGKPRSLLEGLSRLRQLHVH